MMEKAKIGFLPLYLALYDERAAGMRPGIEAYCDELARALETSFAKSGIPYRIIGSMRFYDRKEIKDMLAYLSVVNSPSDNLRLKRIINEPKRKIGAATVDAVEAIAQGEGKSMYTIMKNALSYTALAKVWDKLTSFVEIIENIKASSALPSELIVGLFEKTGYKDMLIAEGFEGEGKIDHVNELVSAAVEYEKRCEESSIDPTLGGFLEEVALISDVDKYDENADAVVLMTIHAAKGLEFPVVFLAGMEDGIFPSQQNMGESEQMSEERRLAYVAITRAKEKLYITYSKNRTMYGRTNFNILSCFVREEIPKHLMERDGPIKASQKPMRETVSAEFKRRPDIFTEKRSRVGAAEYGIERLAPGTRVRHAMFGEGQIITAKDMGGDVLYEVEFDTGVTKKLMATFAKLRKV